MFKYLDLLDIGSDEESNNQKFILYKNANSFFNEKIDLNQLYFNGYNYIEVKDFISAIDQTNEFAIGFKKIENSIKDKIDEFENQEKEETLKKES